MSTKFSLHYTHRIGYIYYIKICEGDAHMDIILTLSTLIQEIHATIGYLRIQDYFHGNKNLTIFTSKITEIISNYANVFSEGEMSSIISALSDIMDAQKNQDYILVADLLEISIIPTFQNALSEIVLSNDILSDTNFLADNLAELRKKDKQYLNLADMIEKYSTNLSSSTSNGYSVECTNSGYPTLKFSSGDCSYYYHSNISPISEGKQFAKYYAKDDIYEYTIWGFGFGYHIREFLNIDHRYSLNVIETNLEVLKLAFKYCDIQDIISNPRFTLSFCNESDLSHHINSNTNSAFIIHYPSMRGIQSKQIRELINNYFINVNSMYAQKKYLDCNFYYNIRLNDEAAHNIMPYFSGKSVIYVAGGPSLEYYLDYIRQRTSDKPNAPILVCASTVYRKLTELSIIPDYVIMIDAQDNMVKHFEETYNTSSSLIYLSTACHKATKNYSGKRYILFQYGYDAAEDYARTNHLSLVETGGSVSTTIIDFLIQCKCSEIITIGLDLAYTDMKSHSFETNSQIENKSLFPVQSTTDGTVLTTHVLNIYRLWIEKRIKNVTNIKFINMSHGAYIKGMENIV